MKISQKGLYALQAMMMLARHYNQGAIRIRDIAYEEVLPEKFLELILLELKNARIVESVPKSQRASMVRALRTFGEAAGEPPVESWSLGWAEE